DRVRRDGVAALVAAVAAALRDEIVHHGRADGVDARRPDVPLEGVERRLDAGPRLRRHERDDLLFVLLPERLPGRPQLFAVRAGHQLRLDPAAQLLRPRLAVAAGAAALAALPVLRRPPEDVPAGALGAVLLHLLRVLSDPRARHR